MFRIMRTNAHNALVYLSAFLFFFSLNTENRFAPILLGILRQRKTKNHLKSATRRENTLIRFGFILVVKEKIKIYGLIAKKYT